MKYKEFIQEVDSLTDASLVLDKNATPWVVDVDDETIKVINRKTNQPLLTIAKNFYGSMKVYELSEPSAIDIYEKAVLLNKTPLKERVDPNPNDYIDDAIQFLEEVEEQLKDWEMNNESLGEVGKRTFYFVGFKLRASNDYLTVDSPHLQGTLSVECKHMDTFDDQLEKFIHTAHLLKSSLLTREETIKSVLKLMIEQGEENAIQFSMDRIIINNNQITISTGLGGYFMWVFKPTYFEAQKVYHESLNN